MVFTDGSCMKKKKETLAGCGVCFPYQQLPNMSVPFTYLPLTNQRAELYAIYLALSAIKQTKFNTVDLYSDSMYSIKCLSEWIHVWRQNNWQTASGQNVKNQDIIVPISNLMNMLRVNFHHIRSHTKLTDNLSIWNAAADQLATQGALQ